MSFIEAFTETMGSEGGYANDPTDRGGETYRGVSRVHHPDWLGWVIIDRLREREDFPQCLNGNREAQIAVQDFYRIEYWDRLLGSMVDEVSPDIAAELFDTAVNMGKYRAVKFLQSGLNTLNRDESLFLDLVEDGKIGKRTIGALKQLTAKDLPVLLKMMNVLQGAHYMAIMGRNHSQEKYARGWFSRVSITKE